MLDAFNPATALAGLQEFLETGGGVLVAIMAATFIMWAFLLERFVYWQFGHAAVSRRAQAAWEERRRALDMTNRAENRYAHWVRERIISEVRLKAFENVEFIKTMVAIAPLLGLLGTVTGMVAVFDVMATSGSSSARAMSAGVSKATIPTMAGMVASLSGLFFSNLVEQAARRSVQKLADELQID